jgi:prophage antirepressor-like protein
MYFTAKITEKDLIPFDFDNFPVRAISKDGDPWFVAKDVCDVLGLENVTEALRNMPANERNTLSSAEGIHEGPGNPNVNIINEPGLYRLIFQSRKPQAEAFKTWVFEEVLPSIRKTGGYLTPVFYKRLEEELVNVVRKHANVKHLNPETITNSLRQMVGVFFTRAITVELNNDDDPGLLLHQLCAMRDAYDDIRRPKDEESDHILSRAEREFRERRASLRATNHRINRKSSVYREAFPT